MYWKSECHMWKKEKGRTVFTLNTQPGFTQCFAYVDSHAWKNLPVSFFYEERLKNLAFFRDNRHPVWCISFLANPEHSIWQHQRSGQAAALQPSQQLISQSSQACRHRALGPHLRDSQGLQGNQHVWATSEQEKTKLLLEAPCSRVSFVCLTFGYYLNKSSGIWAIPFKRKAD